MSPAPHKHLSSACLCRLHFGDNAVRFGRLRPLISQRDDCNEASFNLICLFCVYFSAFASSAHYERSQCCFTSRIIVLSHDEIYTQSHRHYDDYVGAHLIAPIAALHQPHEWLSACHTSLWDAFTPFTLNGRIKSADCNVATTCLVLCMRSSVFVLSTNRAFHSRFHYHSSTCIH